MSNTQRYILKRKKGIDDLKSEYCFLGSSQGDETRTNSIDDYNAAKGWLIPVFDNIDITNQEEINKESARRKKANTDYVEKLKKENSFGEEYEVSIDLVNHPMFDITIRNPRKVLDAHTFIFLDFK